VHVPENIPHGVTSKIPSKMIMIYSPAGFENYLDVIKKNET